MKYIQKAILFFILILGITSIERVYSSASITEIGVPEGFENFVPYSLSSDGSTIVGYAYGNGKTGEPFLWRDDIKFKGLYSILTDTTIISSWAYDVSSDGTVVCGIINRSLTDRRAFRWDIPKDGTTAQVDEYSTTGNSVIDMRATVVSDDGSTIAGYYIDSIAPCAGSIYPATNIYKAFRIKDSTFETLGFLPDADCVDGFHGTLAGTIVEDITADGEVIIGHAGRLIDNQFNSKSLIVEGFKWEGSIAGLDNITNEANRSYAKGISHYGVSIVGVYTTRNDFGESIPELVRWIGGSRENLNYPFNMFGNPDTYSGIGINGSGEFIWYDTAIWDASSGWRGIKEETSSLNLDFSSIVSTYGIEGISNDGNILIVSGHNGISSTVWRIIREVCPDYTTGERTGQWATPTSGLFSEKANWLNNVVPTMLSTLWLNDAGDYTISLDQEHLNAGLLHEAGEVVFDLGGYALYLSGLCDFGLISGDDSPATVGLVFRNGELFAAHRVDLIGGGDSYFSLDDTASMQVVGSMAIDGPSPVIVTIQDGSTLEVEDRLVLGETITKAGALVMHGEGSQLTSKAMIVGDLGEGTVTVDSSSLTLLDTLAIGEGIGGRGTVSITNGATMEAGWITMSLLANSYSSLYIENEFSDLICSDISVGVSDSALLRIVDSATIGGTDTSYLSAGVIEGSSGDIIVSGDATQMNMHIIDLAIGGRGDLQVIDGARVANGLNPMQRIKIASDSGSAGSVLVSGNFAQLLSDTIIVGLDGTAILQCAVDAYVQATTLFIGPLGNIIGNVLYIEQFNFNPKSNSKVDSTGFKVEALTVAEGASLTVDSLFLGQGGKLNGSANLTFDIINEGTLSPGDSSGHMATFTVNGNYTQTVTGILEIELGSGQSDKLSINGLTALEGLISFQLVPGYSPEVGDEFTIMTYTGITDTNLTIESPAGTNILLTVYPDSIRARIDQVTGIDDFTDEDEFPANFTLHQNYPNPFNPSTMINFTLKQRSVVKLEILNVLGQKINELLHAEVAAGNHQVTWDGMTSSGQRVTSGVYFYRLQTENHSHTKKMLLLK